MTQDDVSPQAIYVLSCHWFCPINILSIATIMCATQQWLFYVLFLQKRLKNRSFSFRKASFFIFFFVNIVSSLGFKA